MLFKLLTGVLALLLAAESVYILMHRHPTNRFKPVEEFGYGFVAFDTATGQLCKTVRMGPPLGNQHPTSSPSPLTAQPSGDAFTDELNRAAKEQRDNEEATMAQVFDFARTLPACADIR